MTARVIQGFFIGGRPHVPTSVMQAKASPRAPGSPVPAFVPRTPVAQARGPGDSFQIDPARVGLMSGGGRPLPDAVRGKMEAALGANFSGVRVHVGPQAERIGAVAFTMGNDIYFAPGRFQPDTVQGQQLLGHELAHVVQQRQGRVGSPLGSGVTVVQDRALEAEAERIGRQVAAMRVAPRSGMGTAGHSVAVQRARSQSTTQPPPLHLRLRLRGAPLGSSGPPPPGLPPVRRDAPPPPVWSGGGRAVGEDLEAPGSPWADRYRSPSPGLPPMRRDARPPVWSGGGRAVGEDLAAPGSPWADRYRSPADAERRAVFRAELRRKQAETVFLRDTADAVAQWDALHFQARCLSNFGGAARSPQFVRIFNACETPMTFAKDVHRGKRAELTELTTGRKVIGVLRSLRKAMLGECIDLLSRIRQLSREIHEIDTLIAKSLEVAQFRSKALQRRVNEKTISPDDDLSTLIFSTIPSCCKTLADCNTRRLITMLEEVARALDTARTTEDFGCLLVLGDSCPTLDAFLKRQRVVVATWKHCQAQFADLEQIWPRVSGGTAASSSGSPTEMDEAGIQRLIAHDPPPVIRYKGVTYHRIPGNSGHGSVIYAHLDRNNSAFSGVNSAQMNEYERVMLTVGYQSGRGESGVKQETAGSNRSRQRWWVIKINWNTAHHLTTQTGETVDNVVSPMANPVKIGRCVLLDFNRVYNRH